ncbi:MAG: hypothetical protein K2K72_03455, partial [Duncaniella sp.]|nr:hypothetical protein [Duncaniella sp.]
AYFLPKFRWYGPLRPMEPMEVFDYPAEMADLAKQNILGSMSKDAMTMRGQALGKPVAVPKGALIPGLQQQKPEEETEETDVTDLTDVADTPDTDDEEEVEP